MFLSFRNLATACLVLFKYLFISVVFLENEIMYNERMPMSDEAMSDTFLLPIGKAKIERSGKRL